MSVGVRGRVRGRSRPMRLRSSCGSVTPSGQPDDRVPTCRSSRRFSVRPFTSVDREVIGERPSSVDGHETGSSERLLWQLYHTAAAVSYVDRASRLSSS